MMARSFLSLTLAHRLRARAGERLPRSGAGQEGAQDSEEKFQSWVWRGAGRWREGGRGSLWPAGL